MEIGNTTKLDCEEWDALGMTGLAVVQANLFIVTLMLVQVRFSVVILMKYRLASL